MRVMGISGMPGSGKSFVSEIATKKGAMIVSMGDIIREEAKKRGESTKETAQNLRKEFGENIVAELTVEKIKKILEEGFDSSFIVLSIFANPDIRFERIKSRQREDDTTDYETFVSRDQRELDFGIGDVISLSNKLIINESDLDTYLKEINEFLEEYNI